MLCNSEEELCRCIQLGNGFWIVTNSGEHEHSAPKPNGTGPLVDERQQLHGDRRNLLAKLRVRTRFADE